MLKNYKNSNLCPYKAWATTEQCQTTNWNAFVTTCRAVCKHYVKKFDDAHKLFLQFRKSVDIMRGMYPKYTYTFISQICKTFDLFLVSGAFPCGDLMVAFLT